jgi:hypothetical protein
MAVNDLDLDQIITAIDTAQAAGEPLDRVAAAREVAARLEAFAHHVVAHYVDEARREGASWTDVGAALGVTRQAAQQRFVPAEGGAAAGRTSATVPYSSRATVVLEAVQTSVREQHQNVTDLHLLLALMDNRSGGAIAVLKGLNRRTADVRKFARATLAAESARSSRSATLARTAARTLDVATREALRLGADNVGTEHLLLALSRDEQSPAGRVLAEAGLSYPALRRETASQARLARERPAQQRTRKKHA